MVYIYDSNGTIAYKRDAKPETACIELERMIPMPVKNGYNAVLHADFDSKRVWYELVKIPPTIEETRQAKKEEVENYYNSDDINLIEMTVGTDVYSFYLNPDLRFKIRERLDAAKALGITTTNLTLSGIQLTGIEVSKAEAMYNAIVLQYANAYDVKEGKLKEVDALATIEEIEAYDVTTGYPEKLKI